MQAVDDLVDSIVTRLESEHADVLANTYLIYTADNLNGFHLGQHRLPPGKSCNVEEDINVPFFVRGPGIARGAVFDAPTTHTDIVPTLFTLAGIPVHEDFDGEAMPVTQEMQAAGNVRAEHINVEYWGGAAFESTLPGWVLNGAYLL